MSWERQKATITAEPEEPSLVLWLIVGLIAVIAGALLFILHANHFLGALQKFNLWIVSGSPIFIWFITICLRGWVYNHVMDRHQFESDEADYAQQQWTSWAGRYLAVLYSRVILPDGLTPSIFLQSPKDLEQGSSLCRKITLPSGGDAFSALIGGLDISELQRLSDLPFHATLLTDSHDPAETLQREFSTCWLQLFGQAYPVPPLTILKARSFDWVGERLKSPILDVELLLVHQTQGEREYSDALAALLLTSDDVATKYQLSHHARLLRPMSLEPTEALDEALDMFFSTQSHAIKTHAIVGDSITWGDNFSALLVSAKKYEGRWKPQQCHWLERYAGLSGPFSPWILAAVVSDIAALMKEDCLMVSIDKERRYMNTVTTGNLMNGEG
ncbi:hypothetical protein C3432_03990 [Citrobacter amalonaticus]|uniref:Type VI secretion protein n=1 Tax=Citrobacter amalonaticus TaxID=35703 RepID=A0A2S4S3P8_CITAM|nr:hypothetical protein [Citrobacter amalonaticus]POT59876.1 hypothetical protein C3432_03990 [Citrobacter amalonaticus]POT78007.1 hypothetical protein C3436_11660 [Citrobacter amalonaticus]POU68459.1 hypothetical protein C3430_05195 [Citrobacter amalonaticus]POV08062.1 hypothetical protein C3424_05205 [Citrobacter amalonaticus]